MSLKQLSVISALILIACSVGQGRGQARGGVRLDDCGGIRIDDYDLRPNFFAADFTEDIGAIPGEIQRIVYLRMQRGSFRETDSDGIAITIDDVNWIKREMLGVPIAVSPSSAVRMTAYFDETCQSGMPREHWIVPGVLQAQSGTITFDEVYAPDVNSNETTFAAHFENVQFGIEEARSAHYDGDFEFLYQRGRPGQTFP